MSLYPQNVLVVGGGVIGTCISESLQRRAHRVTLIERSGIGEGCSSGNAGMLSVSGCVPLNRPETLLHLPHYLFKSDSPVSLDVIQALRNIPWLARFVMSSAPKKVTQIAATLALLLRRAQPELFATADRTGSQSLFERLGCLYLYRNQEALQSAHKDFDFRRKHGIDIEYIDRGELQRLEPVISPLFDCAAFIPDNAHCRNPLAFTRAVGDEFLRLGGTLVTGDVTGISPQGDLVHAHLHDGRIISGTTLVVAAGVWSKELLAPLGVRVLLEPHRGYHVTANTGNRATLRRPVIWEEHGFAVTPMQDGLRATGFVEITQADSPPDPRRLQQLRCLLPQIVSDVDVSDSTSWVGSRPATPDSLPIIGRTAAYPQILVATGHGQLGLSLSAITARIVSDLISMGKSDLDVAPLSPDRFI